MGLVTEPYLTQASKLPQVGRQIIAQYDEVSITVYQAYRPTIGHFAATHGYFGGEFSFSRMSWIKPNFLWMMYRSGWGKKTGQEVILAVKIQRSAFDECLALAVHSHFVPDLYDSELAWQQAIQQSSVRLQWDPDRDPNGGKLERRAIQLGLRDDVLTRYAQDWILDIEDISDFVQQQRQFQGDWSKIQVPSERVYPVVDAEIAKRIGISIEE